MTPTLAGRWQTRILMLATIGAAVSALFAVLRNDDGPYFLVLAYVAAFGIAWDVGYIALQKLRWDRDWPAAFQVATGITEALFIFVLIALTGLPGIGQGSVSAGVFAAQYGLIWLTIFVWVQGPMRVLLPFWRFHGGRILPTVSSRERER